jgi:branched-chain amino acid transport system permease protein
MDKKSTFSIFLSAIIAILLFFALPFYFPSRILLIRILIFGLFASAYNILFGYTRRISFGHAALFGLGSYTTGLTLLHAPFPLGVTLVMGGLMGAGFAWIMGYLSLRRGGVYCAMISLALAQVVYFTAFRWRDLTGGDDGLRGLPLNKIIWLGMDMTDSLYFYYFSLVITAASLWVMHHMLESPFGMVLRAIGENENRAKACGYNVYAVKVVAFVISGFFSGLAGALYAILFRSVPIDTLHWLLSGEVVMMTILGGAGTFFGPFIGAVIYCISEDRINLVTTHWQIFVGCVFIVIILFAPKGLWGALVDGKVFSRLKMAFSRVSEPAMESHSNDTIK